MDLKIMRGVFCFWIDLRKLIYNIFIVYYFGKVYFREFLKIDIGIFI